jgi:hypothetical protein
MRLPIVGMVLVVGGTQIAVVAFAISFTRVYRDDAAPAAATSHAPL